MIHTRLGCSTISFRHLPLPQALATIAELGFAEIDLGALPGVCDHVPYVLDAAAVADVAATVAASGLRVRSINGDIGDLNAPLDPEARARRDRHLDMLVALAAATGSRALVLPCGALDHTPIDTLDADLDRVAAELVAAAGTAAAHGVELWVESLHFHRLCFNIERAQQLTSRLDQADHHVGIVMDFSHIIASGGDPVEFVEPVRPAHRACPHPRRGAGQHQPVGRQRRGGLRPRAQGPGRRRLPGHFSLELETRDITHDERPAAAATSRATDFRTHLRRKRMTTPTKTAIITGATSDRGIGMTVAQRYAREGWAVVILDLDGEKSAKVASRHRQPVRRSRVRPRRRRHLRGVGDRRPRRRRRRGGLRQPAARSARWPTSPASPPRCRSWRPRWICGTWSWPSTPPAPTW